MCCSRSCLSILETKSQPPLTSVDDNSTMVAPPIIVHATIMCSRHEETLPMCTRYNHFFCSVGFSVAYGSTLECRAFRTAQCCAQTVFGNFLVRMFYSLEVGSINVGNVEAIVRNIPSMLM